jgi:DNA adenine methylase
MEPPEKVQTSKHVRYVTPLRYPGGKSKLAGFVRTLLEKNDLAGGTYVEPFAGGASIAISLLLSDHVAKVHINDLDLSIYAFWHSVIHETEALCRLIRNKRISVAEWRRQHLVQRNRDSHDLLGLGFSTFFLNRTNRSGIICSGGMIGGANQNGKWKLDARFNKHELVQRIERIASLQNRITIHREDAEHLLQHLLPLLPQKTLVYLDPPYYVKGQRRLYANFYQHNDHERIAGIMRTTRTPWLVSYDDQPEIQDLYRDFRSCRYRLTYTVRERAEGSEVLFFSNGLSIPGTLFGSFQAITCRPRQHEMPTPRSTTTHG